LLVYFASLTTDISLGMAGTYTTGAMYASGPAPPGYPLWTLVAHVFTVLLPFSNIAWRVALSSALAAALTSGLVSLLAARSATLLVENLSTWHRLNSSVRHAGVVVSSAAAGLGFAFDSAFWWQAVVPHVWPLSMLLSASVLALLMRWMFCPERQRYLYAASFVYGLTLTNSQALIPVIPGLLLSVMLRDRQLARDLLFVLSLAIWGSLLVAIPHYPVNLETVPWRKTYCWIGVGSSLSAAVLTIRTRGLFTCWKQTSAVVAAFALGLSPYLWLPISSMTNPPINWAYPRTVVGFMHLVTRGQFEQISPSATFVGWLQQLRWALNLVMEDFGLCYFLLALIPLCVLHRAPKEAKCWLLATVQIFVCLSFFLIFLLNPPLMMSRDSIERTFLSAFHIVLAIWSGCGMLLLTTLTAPRS
jgi:hypothetical protein